MRTLAQNKSARAECAIDQATREYWMVGGGVYLAFASDSVSVSSMRINTTIMTCVTAITSQYLQRIHTGVKAA
eukprot:COSAG02_NODE_419_length_22613_cov_22.994492_19_plen_73_part_00